MNFYRINQRFSLLLEVLIAFTLVALCVLPLIYPHVYILRSEKKFIATVELDHLVNLLYATILQKLYQNEIPWADIENGKELPIDESWVESLGYKNFPFTGTYKFSKKKQRPKEPTDQIIYLFQLEFFFNPKPGFFLDKKTESSRDKITYTYLVPMERLLK